MENNLEEIKEFLVSILKAVLRQPDQLRVHVGETTDQETNEPIIQVSIKTADMDIGQAIGKSGLNATALRTVVHMFCVKLGIKQRLVLWVDAPKLPSHFERE